ncbi:MAG: DnaJ domain-containing protein [Proteobacteria bacterium]|nr:DnaJ domain-containing protein [Pseudomonadota bacterium]
MLSFDNKPFSYEDTIEAYKVLKIDLCANFAKQVKTTYRKLAKKLHPDKNKSPNAEEEFKVVDNAYRYIEKYQDEIEQNKEAITQQALLPKRPVSAQQEQPPVSPFQKSQTAKPDTSTRQRKRETAAFRKAQAEAYFQELRKAAREVAKAREAARKAKEAQEAAQRAKEAKEAALRAKKLREEEILRQYEENVRINSEIACMLYFLNNPVLSESNNMYEMHESLMARCSAQLITESKLLSSHQQDMIERLVEINSKLSKVAAKVNLPAIIFPELNNRYKREAELLSFYQRKIQYDLTALKLYNVHFEHALMALKTEKNYYNFYTLNNKIELLNTEIANIQLKPYYSMEIGKLGEIKVNPLSKELKLSGITRITEAFVSNNQDLASYFNTFNSLNLFKVTDTLSNWSSIQNLQIKNSPYLGIPACISQMPNLISVDLQGNKIASLPDSISNLTNLKHLNLNNNCLSKLPSSFEQLFGLNHLILSNNYFAEIPIEITKLFQLTTLNFENSYEKTNNIRHLPQEMENLGQLEQLYLSGNAISYLPENVIPFWKKLQILSIANNSLATLPKNIGDLAALKILDARNNNIPFIPSSILKIKNSLENCYLDNNLLHQHILPVAAILSSFGNNLFEPLIASQHLQDSYPMEIDNQFSFDQDESLLEITNQYLTYLRTKYNAQALDSNSNACSIKYRG